MSKVEHDKHDNIVCNSKLTTSRTSGLIFPHCTWGCSLMKLGDYKRIKIHLTEMEDRKLFAEVEWIGDRLREWSGGVWVPATRLEIVQGVLHRLVSRPS